jgi:hypothetical protein
MLRSVVLACVRGTAETYAGWDLFWRDGMVGVEPDMVRADGLGSGEWRFYYRDVVSAEEVHGCRLVVR